MKYLKIILFLVLPISCFSQTTKDSSRYVLESRDTLLQIVTTTVSTNTVQSVNKSIENIVKPYIAPPVVVPPIVTPPPVGTRSNLILDNSFDDGKLTGFTLANGQYCCTYSLNVVAAPDNIGKAVKYDLRSSDAIVSSSKRSEMQLNGTDAPQESERWYGLRYWFEKYDVDNGPESILQWHDDNSTTPPLSIQVSGGRMNLTTSFLDLGNKHYDMGPTTIGKWISVVIHVKWTTGNTGVLECWVDGVKKVSNTGARTNSGGGNGSYMKIGINKWPWAPGGGSSTATQRIFYIDNFRMGNEKATYNDVAP